MSGGSFDYKYIELEDYYEGRMEDVELNEMITDLAKLLHDLEWWKSYDYAEEDYRKTVQEFKNKWFGKRDELLRKRIINELDELKVKLNNL